MDNKRAFIGIDNGVTGSIGIIFTNGKSLFAKTPVKSTLNYTKKKSNITRVRVDFLRDLLKTVGPLSMVMIERPLVNPGRFAATASALRAFEATIIVLEELDLPYEVCDSKEWQKSLLPEGAKGDELKKFSLEVGNRLYPGYRQNEHPDRDGLLIAHFCKQKHK